MIYTSNDLLPSQVILKSGEVVIGLKGGGAYIGDWLDAPKDIELYHSDRGFLENNFKLNLSEFNDLIVTPPYRRSSFIMLSKPIPFTARSKTTPYYLRFNKRRTKK